MVIISTEEAEALYGMPKVMSIKDVFKKQREAEEASQGK